MKQERLLKVLVGPVISEKSTRLEQYKDKQYAFVVTPDATKPEVKTAVEQCFKVQVESVQILNIKGKKKRFGRGMGRRSDVRKAYVRLAEGQSINFVQEVK